MVELFREFFWLIFPILGTGIAFVAVFGEFARQRRALDVLRVYAEKGTEPPASVLSVLSRASAESKKRNPLASFVFFLVMALGFTFTAGWFNSSPGAWPFVLGFGITAFVMAALAASNLVLVFTGHAPRMASDDDDAALVAAARDGSNAALSRLVDRHQQAVRAFLARMVGNREEAEDLAQETFVTACSQLAHYRGEASMRTWLCAIAWRKAKSARRSFFRRRTRDAQYAERADQERPGEISAEDSMALKAALASLPLEQRAAVVLCLSEDFSHTEAAEALSLPLGTVKSHVTRGRARLLSVLGGES